MLRLRPYKACDAEKIVSWIKDEKALRTWSSDRFNGFPLTKEELNRKYLEQNGDCTEEDNFYPMTLCDDREICGHLILRYTNGNPASIRFGFVIVDDAKRGKGLGKEMLRLACDFAFNVLRAEKITLGVFENNTPAYKCYKASGFSEISNQPNETYDFHGEKWKIIELEKFNSLNYERKIFVNDTEYKTLKLLGHGKGGYSYLAEKGGKLFVLKQIHHEPCTYYTFGNKIEAEQNDYKRLCNAEIRIPKMIELDVKNERIVKEYIAGSTISSLVEKGLVKEDYILQVQEMAEKAKASGLNIDYFPTNFVVSENEGSEGKLFYIDYECNSYMDEWNFENWGIKYWEKK